METKIVADEGVGMNLFKSYYVVWKLFFTGTAGVGGFLFKSYYVVWKRRGRVRGYLPHPLFKSYYVVWKQLPVNCILRVDIGLNRTM